MFRLKHNSMNECLFSFIKQCINAFFVSQSFFVSMRILRDNELCDNSHDERAFQIQFAFRFSSRRQHFDQIIFNCAYNVVCVVVTRLRDKCAFDMHCEFCIAHTTIWTRTRIVHTIATRNFFCDDLFVRHFNHIISFCFYVFDWNTIRCTHVLLCMHQTMHQSRIFVCVIVLCVVNERRCIWLHQFATFRTIVFVVAMCAIRVIETHIATRVCIFTHCFVRIRVVRVNDCFCRFDVFDVCIFNDIFIRRCIFARCHLNHIISFRYFCKCLFAMHFDNATRCTFDNAWICNA